MEMSKMLSKMNLISVVQQLPSEDIELVQNYVEMIEEENEELKKQLEERSKDYCNVSKVKHDYAKKLVIIQNQQQEFINYLEDEIKITKEEWGNKLIETGYLDIAMTVRAYQIILQKYQIILQKYKEIIGVSK